MKNTATASRRYDWDTRIGLTLAGCVAVAGMPLDAKKRTARCTDATESAAKPMPATDAPAERETFRIDSMDAANWYLKKVASIEAEKARIQAQTEKMIAELDADLAQLKYLYEGELQAFVRAELAKKGNRRRTLHLLQGSCVFRTVPASVKVADTAAALAHAKEWGLPCIETTERLLASRYKELAGEELLPGMETTPEHETFAVNFGKKEQEA
jgi:phage host-nuclease inhibitor protein Gam